MENIIVDSIENLDLVLDRVREAQKEFSKYTQEQVDKLRLLLIKLEFL